MIFFKRKPKKKLRKVTETTYILKIHLRDAIPQCIPYIEVESKSQKVSDIALERINKHYAENTAIEFSLDEVYRGGRREKTKIVVPNPRDILAIERIIKSEVKEVEVQ